MAARKDTNTDTTMELDAEKPKARRGRPRKKAEVPAEVVSAVSEDSSQKHSSLEQSPIPSELENEELYKVEVSEEASTDSVHEQEVISHDSVPFDFSEHLEVQLEQSVQYTQDENNISVAEESHPSLSDSDYTSEPVVSAEPVYEESSISSKEREFELEMTQDRAETAMSMLVESQRNFFNTNQTRNVSWRIEQLKKLYSAIQQEEAAIEDALRKDLSKAPAESFLTEIGVALHEISYVIKHLKKWSKTKKMFCEIPLFPATVSVAPEPVGVTLVMSTWNYPFLLSIGPVISSIAAGNTVVLKTSEYASETNTVVKNLLERTFDQSFVAVVAGGYTENHALLNQHFDFIFFTGSQNVGRVVMSSAARFLTPVCLELGGKSPCIVDSSANLELAARRIVWGKFINAGQTCVAPDYILVDQGVKDRLVELIKAEVVRAYGEKPLENPDYCKIINERRFVHLSTLCPNAEMDFISNKIAPTVMDLGGIDSREVEDADAMKEEIFGPILPVVSYDNISSVVEFILKRPSPLALYIFSTNKDNIKFVTNSLRFGGGCVNDVVAHTGTSKAPFGGVGESGMGSYHGKAGFDTFSHYKTVLNQSAKHDVKFRYAPYTEKTLKLLKLFLK